VTQMPQVPHVGDTSGPRTFGPISRTDIVRYAGASGDFNPLHHDDDYAQAAGHPGAFSIGMFQAALLATFATDWLGATTIRQFAVRFNDRVWPDDELTCAGTVTDVRDETPQTVVEVDLVCRRQTGTIALAGTARFAFSLTQTGS
jgi:acyl dehydratase